MPLITRYDYVESENERVKILSGDIIVGSGSNLLPGDYVTVSDLVFDMFLPSGNDAATAIARY